MDSNINRIQAAQTVQRASAQQKVSSERVARRASNAYESQKLERSREGARSETKEKVNVSSGTTIKAENAAELTISDAGRKLAANLVAQTKAPVVKDMAQARNAVVSVGEALNRDPELGAALHSNLRVMRVNQLIFE